MQPAGSTIMKKKMNKCPVLLVALRLCAVEMFASAALLKPRLNSICSSCNSNVQRLM